MIEAQHPGRAAGGRHLAAGQLLRGVLVDWWCALVPLGGQYCATGPVVLRGAGGDGIALAVAGAPLLEVLSQVPARSPISSPISYLQAASTGAPFPSGAECFLIV